MDINILHRHIIQANKYKNTACTACYILGHQRMDTNTSCSYKKYNQQSIIMLLCTVFCSESYHTISIPALQFT